MRIWNLSGATTQAELTDVSTPHVIVDLDQNLKDMIIAPQPIAQWFFNGDGISIEGWVRDDDITSEGYILYKQSDGNTYFRLKFLNSQIQFDMIVAAAGPQLNHGVSINTWYHLVITVSPTGDIFMYIDGALVNQDTSTLAAIMGDGVDSDLLVGYDGSHAVEGHIDTLAIYDRVLTAHQVGSLYSRATEGW